MRTAQEVVGNDLDHICSTLQKEFESLSGKNLLITGGAGFLGYYLVQSVLHWNASQSSRRAIRLTVYDNYTRGFPAWLANLQHDKHLTLVKHDVTKPLPRDMGDFQFIVHAASIASPIFYRKYPIETMDANVNGLRSLLDYCRRKTEQRRPIEGFLFYSTSEVYGDPSPDNIPTPETYRGNVSCTGPRACYDESKRYGETLCVNFAEQHDLPIKMVRPFNNYGPGLKLNDTRVLSDFARNILSGEDIIMFSDGSPTRTFCYITDAIIGYFKVLTRGANGEAYNIGAEEPEISIAGVANRMVSISRELFGYGGRVIHRSNPDQEYLTDNPSRRCPSIAKARSHLGFEPSVSLDEGLKRSLVWYDHNREAKEAS